MAEHGESPSGAGPRFVTTRWSLVLAAQEKESPESAAALETLCRVYWYPLYAYVRGTGRSVHDAQDLTQEFFARLLEKDWLHAAERGRGRFRTFLIISMKWFLANESQRCRAEKRGGGKTPVPFDGVRAEERYRSELEEGAAPDLVYDRRWALALLDQSLQRLRAEYERAGRIEEFEALKGHLTAERGTVPYAELAGVLRTTEGAARVAMHRARKRFRVLFREAIADTVSRPEEVEDELRFVVAVLTRASEPAG